MDLHDVTAFLGRPLEFPLIMAFIAFFFGALVGSYLNVCIYRMPLEKSLWWPGSHCSNCWQRLKTKENIPILSYLRLKGKCSTCGVQYGSRHFWIELGTALLFAISLYFYLQLGSDAFSKSSVYLPKVSKFALLGMWLYHILFLCFLIVAIFTDFDHREIPLRLTVTGTIIGIIGGTLGGWPWPRTSVPSILSSFGGYFYPTSMTDLPIGMQHWPFWAPWELPVWGEVAPCSMLMGFVTSALGAIIGSYSIRFIRTSFSWAYEREAMGLGDADLFMMIGAFLGWQALVFVLIFGVLLGILQAVATVLISRSPDMPFGPALAGGAIITLYDPLLFNFYPAFQRLFFDPLLIALVAVLLLVVFGFTCVIIRFFRVMMRPMEV